MGVAGAARSRLSRLFFLPHIGAFHTLAMKKRLFLFVAIALCHLVAVGQWNALDRLMDEGSYKTDYTRAEAELTKAKTSRQRLTAAWYMQRAAVHYQDDAIDSSHARYRRLLPTLDGVDSALCYAMMGSYDSALANIDLLMRTPIERSSPFATGGKTLNVTPTMLDLIVVQMQDEGATSLQRRIEWQRTLCRVHAESPADVQIWHALRLLSFLQQRPNSELSADTVQALINHLRNSGSEQVASIYAFMANMLNWKHQYVAAMAYCDTAIARWPKTEGGVQCANIRSEITRPIINLDHQGQMVSPSQHSLQNIMHRNTPRIYYRIVPLKGKWRYDDKGRKQLLAAKIVGEGVWQTAATEPYCPANSLVALPPIDGGRYALMLSPTPDFTDSGFVAYEMACTDMQLVCVDETSGWLVNRHTGKPLHGRSVQLYSTSYQRGKVDTTLVATTTTKHDGFFRFDKHSSANNLFFAVSDGAYTIHESVRRQARFDQSSSPNCAPRIDRPVYHQSDTIHLSVLLYKLDGISATTLVNTPLTLLFSDPDGQLIHTDTVLTNHFGIAEALFVVPTDRMLGEYSINIMCNDRLVGHVYPRIEAYKQPRFKATIAPASDSVPRLYRPLKMVGNAMTYSDLPLEGAKVNYAVKRCRLLYGRNWHNNGNGCEVVASGSTTVASDGTFDIVFTPQPDSNVQFVPNTAFEFTVDADVSDVDGETHRASSVIRVGFRQAFFALQNEDTNVSSLAIGNVKIYDINGNEIRRDYDVKVERLKVPEKALIDHYVMSEHAVNTLSREDFSRLFPHLAYDLSYNNPATWEVADSGLNGSGVYRLTYTAADVDTFVCHQTLTLPGCKRVQSQRLVWTDADKHKANVGERVNFRIGSRFDGVNLLCTVLVGNSVKEMSTHVANGKIATISIDVDSSMLGGFYLYVMGFRGGMFESSTEYVDVPFTHKHLNVEVVDVEKQMQPGSKGRWRLHVTDAKGHGVQAAMAITLYDEALDIYGSVGQWRLWPWRSHKRYNTRWPYFSGQHTYSSYWLRDNTWYNYEGQYPTVWHMTRETRPLGGHIMYKSRAMSNSMKQMATADMAEDAEEEMVAYDESVATLQEVAVDETEMPAEHARTNMNTLAFFVPFLTTDSMGFATVDFNLPDLLTKWHGIVAASTNELQTGTEEWHIVAKKRLMVQANMPRFLRVGDSLMLPFKVMVDSAEAQTEVEVRLLVADKYTSDTICTLQQTVVANHTAQVLFAIHAPEGESTLRYEITAHTPSANDAERGEIEVISDRRQASVSQPLYVNGPGCKRFVFKPEVLSSPTHTPLMLTAEVTANPIWLAVGAMPYVNRLANPSSIFLATQAHVATIGRSLATQFADLKLLSATDSSALRRHLADYDDLLSTTPWTSAAKSHEAQMADVARYIDTLHTDSLINEAIHSLINRQNADGGWGWMPDAPSSVWITTQVLTLMVDADPTFDEAYKRALAYVDREQQRYYEKYIKPHINQKRSPEATNVDYLYMRTMYGKASTEAYAYHLNNALKSYARTEHLYTEAQLALIFSRTGHRKEATDLLRRLRERCLTDDEQGTYWRDNRATYHWYARPIETQAMLIKAFCSATKPDTLFIGHMQQWLLKQRQATHWGNERATAEAIDALMFSPKKGTALKADSSAQATLTLFGRSLTAQSRPGSPQGYVVHSWSGDSLQTLLNGSNGEVVLEKADRGMTWGSVVYHYTDRADRLQSNASGISVRKSMSADAPLNVGQRVKLTITLKVDRAMDYIVVDDERAACFEPVDTHSGWRHMRGASCYVEVGQTTTRFFIEHLERGTYTFDYEIYATTEGRFLSGATTARCLYAPEFQSTQHGTWIDVE